MCSPEDMQRMLTHLREKTGYVELDVSHAQPASTMVLASENADRAAESKRRGERVAYLYTHEYNAQLAPQPPHYAFATGVNAVQARELMAAGAKWIGPDFYRPI